MGNHTRHASLQCGPGRVIYSMYQKISFDKPALSIAEQISLLDHKHLILDDTNTVAHCLTTIGYYRLMIYFRPFLTSSTDSSNIFKPNTHFSDILDLYVFDRELRLLVTDALERIEVSFRTAISNTMSLKYGSHWYLNPDLFSRNDQYIVFLEEIKSHLRRSHEDFIKTYYSKYNHPEHPPSWMVMECLSFGTISKMYSNIKDRSVRKEVGDLLGQYSEIIKSWMRSITYTRNLCAHHSRLWNRFFVNKPQITTDTFNFENNESPFYLQAYVIQSLLNKVAPGNYWQTKLFDLFHTHTNVSFSDMGFTSNWIDDPFWEL